MGLFAVLETVIAALDRAGVGHMVSGSVASARHGEARATQDIDIVIDATASQMQDLVARLASSGMYVGDGLEALRHRTQFNVIDTTTGWKVDLIVLKDRPYSRTEFARRVRTEIGGISVCIVSAEDSILSKLEWARSSRSERQLRDVAGLVSVNGASLDWQYIRDWAVKLDVTDLLAEVMSDIELPSPDESKE